MKQFESDTDDMPMSEDNKPTYIQEQHNYNCQQFFGPITNCTFTMPAAKPSSASRKPKPPKQKNTGEKRLSGKPKTLKYCSHGNKGVLRKQGERIALVFKKWNEWGWIGSETSTDDFDALFEGEPRHCNITWKANTTVLTLLLQKLLKQPYITEQKSQSASSMVKAQFGLTPNFDEKRLAKDDDFKIEVTVYLLNITPTQRGRR